MGDRPNLSAKRLTNVLSPLRQMLAEATHDGILDADPMHGLRIKRRRGKEREDVDPFTPEEVTAILGKAEGQVRNLIAFAVGSGLRTSELIALRWAEVDFVAGAVLVRAAFVRGRRKAPKTQAGIRRVELTPLALDALRAQKAHSFLKGEEVFQNPNTGEPWGGDMQIRQRHWTPLLKRAGVRYRYPYQTRHTYASTMLSAGENVMWVARQLGHADWGVTARTYARFIPSIDPDAGAKGGGALPAFGQLSG
jgi:integrase